jgi:hypothetical protein
MKPITIGIVSKRIEIDFFGWKVDSISEDLRFMLQTL